MKVALIGGAGFVGHHLALALRARGDDVLCCDSWAVNNVLSVISMAEMPHAARYLAMVCERLALLRAAGASLEVVDARDYHALSRVIARFSADAVVQLAAVSHIDRANKDPHSTFDHSLRTLENALDVTRAIHAHFVYFSSSTVYGDFRAPTVWEDTPCQPKGIYGTLKLAGELIVAAYRDTYEMPATIIRPCALYGPRCISGRVPQKFIEAALQGEPLAIHGDDRAEHDFTSVHDLVAGVLLVFNKDIAKGETFNLTAGASRTLNALANIVQGAFPTVTLGYAAPDPEKPSRGTLAVTKARRLLGYEPRYTLEQGMADYIAWYRDFWK